MKIKIHTLKIVYMILHHQYIYKATDVCLQNLDTIFKKILVTLTMI